MHAPKLSIQELVKFKKEHPLEWEKNVFYRNELVRLYAEDAARNKAMTKMREILPMKQEDL